MDWRLILIGENGPTPKHAERMTEALRVAGATSEIASGGTSEASLFPVLEVRDPQDRLDRAKIHRIAAQLEMDVHIAARPPAECKLLVADMEATIIEDEMLDLLADMRGIGPAVADITARTMAGELDFSQSLKARTKLLAGTSENLLRELCGRIRYTPGAKALVQTMRTAGAKTVLVTGGYDIFAQVVARHCGFDEVVSNHPVFRDGVMTGELQLPICNARTKREQLLRYCGELGIGPHSACCVGDGANDVEMLQSCGLAVSYKGKPVVQKIVDLNITNGSLIAALYAQGFTAARIADH
ncbi:phosphoserine phosphatase SerB [Nitratireductor pacificus]|uniref:Phosphoserine phosphatase n=1 Tax=Nitratireductor pacificus pht-3B TaxID=391937 RepID=K2MS66_9HYPH|nr:phosphoserine phosphatase SerB [Nitratireductor pacificus]EKF20177.1 phosphoserine phosphatase [Nitratireductor pacificus pht-3B]